MSQCVCAEGSEWARFTLPLILGRTPPVEIPQYLQVDNTVECMFLLIELLKSLGYIEGQRFNRDTPTFTLGSRST